MDTIFIIVVLIICSSLIMSISNKSQFVEGYCSIYDGNKTKLGICQKYDGVAFARSNHLARLGVTQIGPKLLIGHDPFDNPEYKRIYPRGKLIPTKKDKITNKGNKWETRFPSLVPQRHSYNDRCAQLNDDLVHMSDVARLSELPIYLNKPSNQPLKPTICLACTYNTGYTIDGHDPRAALSGQYTPLPTWPSW